MLLRSLTKHIKDQNWFAVVLDFFIVVVGILIAFQITEWSNIRQQQELEESYLSRLVDDLDESINYLNSEATTSIKIKSIIESSLATLNTKNSSDAELIEATKTYISDGAWIQGFKVSRTTFDDLKSTGNLKIIRNTELVQLLGQLHTDFADHELDSLVNTDWLLPFESKIAIDFDFMRFDQRAKHLFPERTVAEIAEHIREHYDLLQRHAALHYWYTDVISDDYASAVEEAQKVKEVIMKELESE